MIIQSLCRYYDILKDDPAVEISEYGSSNAKVSFVFVLSPEGELNNIVALGSDDARLRFQLMDVPMQESRSGKNPPPYFLCDNAKYVLGVEWLKKADFQKKYPSAANGENPSGCTVLEENEKGTLLVHGPSEDRFQAFKGLHHEILDGTNIPAVASLLTFLDAWNPETALDHPKIQDYKDDIFTGGNVIFECEGAYLHKIPAIRALWESHYARESAKDEQISQCLVTGNAEPVARLHQKIKGVTGAQSSGASLVSFNADAFESYGKGQSYNSPVGTLSMFKYTTTLNHMLASERNRIRIGDSTVVYWAETSNSSCEDLAGFFFNPPKGKENENGITEGEDDSRIRDAKTIRQMGDILNKVRRGRHLNRDDLGTDADTKFFILGLAPNNARLAVRFWYVDIFGEFIEKIARHYLDMEIIRDDFGSPFVTPYQLLKETSPKSADRKEASPILGGLLMRSILNGTGYPVQMYSAILSRVKVERSINYARAGFIKAYLLRQSRSGSSPLKEELISVKLNEENPDVPYRLGRLFAVLEKVQSETNKNMGSTITSKYFSSASTTPAVVYPVLLKLAQHHIAKSDWGFKTTQSIEEILSGVDAFPEYLTLEEQGMFMLGYYHQRKANYSKKNEKAVEEE
ncbi:type I-C CRISPR-associated protein Cas8c/Csd1 [Methanomicrobiaceae archaeon CYW5]|uniref:type I-C CRISPR-associated protein Cas8c/Csd1 n=1 Tax=Methanovulcanius yangii TaxID=1789227 RepID=UPI0029CA7DD0|nr:type I-C CRISPR-associated protein Cas8c/Csd1 [Methanovulcanius yangii]MBT8508782.1 type I-C CRISPR-associated protein Cas8c/Csd1 [Methanovulcanius yangii]